MKHRIRVRSALAVALAAYAFGALAQPAQMPEAMKSLVGVTAPTDAGAAAGNLLALNRGMFELYDDAAGAFSRNIQASHPIVMALFSGSGGNFTLFRPGQPPLEAPPVPVVYQLLKSVGHSTMALTQVVGPYVDGPANPSWTGPMLAYRSRMQLALAGLDSAGMPSDWRENNRTLLQANLAFMDECLAKRTVSYAALQAFSRQQAPYLARNVAWAAQTQVAHWMKVMAEWKTMLGPQWERTYGISNTIYVARQNNVLFSVLAQFFGADAINDRLLLIETPSFTTTKAEMMVVLTRIVADRSVGQLFFGNDRLMDYELMGGDARDAIMAETARLGMKTVLPPAVPFGSRQWPALVTPGSGPSSLKDLRQGVGP